MEWSVPGACSAPIALDCSTVLLAEMCRGFGAGFPQPGYLPARRARDKEEWAGMRSSSHTWNKGSFSSLVRRISSKQPMAREQTVSPLTSVAPTLDLNTASSPGLDSAGAGALPRCEKRGCELPSCLFAAFPATPKRSICPLYLLPLLQPGFTAHIGLL